MNPFAKNKKPFSKNENEKSKYPENPLLKVDIHEVLTSMNAINVGDDKWNIENFGHVVIKQGTQSFTLPTKENYSGYGAVELVKQILSVDFKEAITWMKSHIRKDAVMASDKPQFQESPFLKVDIHEVLNAMGAADRGGDKWKIANFGHVIIKPGTQAFLLPPMGDMPGYGGIDLVKKIFDIEFKEALDWMKANLPEDPMMVSESGMAVGNNRHFTPPSPHNANRDKVFKYLVEDRKLPSKLVEGLMKDGSIYADRKNRCVFLSDSGAEVRSAYEGENTFKGGVDGNDPSLNDFGFQVEANPNAILNALAEKKLAPAVGVTEAAITGLSYHTLNPHVVVLSSNGAGRFGLHFSAALDTYYDESIPFQMPFHMAMDADNAGDYAAQRLWNALYIRERLAAGLNIDIEEVDQWIRDGDIVIDLRSDVTFPDGTVRKMMIASPHICFFGLDLMKPNEYPEGLKVLTLDHSKEMVEGEDLPLIETGELSPPIVSFTVSPGLHQKLNRKEYRNIPVDKVNFDKVDWCLRARPKNGKDWNDELKLMGQKAHQDYLRKTSPLASNTKKLKLK